jgi:hypothetical protein
MNLPNIRRRIGLLTRVALMLGYVMTPDVSRGATAFVKLDLRTQLARADYVIQGKIIEKRHVGPRQVDQPIGSCGVLYRLQILRQFKGEHKNIDWFATHRIVFPERPLSVGDKVLVLLRDLARERSMDSEILKAELEQSYAAIRACGSPPTSLYLADYEENIFPIVAEGAGASRVEWLKYSSGRTTIALDSASIRPANCEPVKTGCVETQAARADWRALSRAIKDWIAKD